MGLSNEPVAGTSSGVNGDDPACPKMKAADEVIVTKRLESTFAEEGSKICLHCSFSLQDSQYLYVAWNIGIYTIERSSSDFEVISRGGDFILYIKAVQLDMAGKVVCEIRKALPNRKYTSITKSNACITVLPKNNSHQTISIDRTNAVFKTKVYEETQSDCRRSSQLDNFNKCVESSHRYSCTVNGRRRSLSSNLVQQKNRTLEIIYCRLEEKYFHFLDTRFADDVENESRPPVRLLAAEDRSLIKLNWSNSYDSHCWYAIDLVQDNGTPVEVAVSSCPELEVRCAPPGHVVRVRVRRVDVLDGNAEYNVSILPSIEKKTLPKCDLIKPKSHFEECYEKVSSEVLGYGAFGSVYLVKNVRGNCFAAKVIKTRTQKKRESARREYEVMRKLDHPKLVALFDAYCAVDTFVLVMEYLWGGELLERVAEEEHFKEIDAVTYVRQICEALQYLHNLNIVHLDLKPENIVCISPNSNQIKLIDFGIAKVLQDGQVVKAIYGTRDYIAPEVLNYEPLTTACDMWSFGVVTYVLLSGVIPFPGTTWAERCANITKANYNFDEMAFDEISSQAKDFIKALLQKKPCNRLTAEEALSHCWLVEGPPTPAVPIKLTTINLKTYVATIRTRWQRAANVMIAANRLRCFQLRAPLS